MPTGTMNKGWGLALMDQIQNENTAHQSVVGRIEKITGRSTIGYFTHFQHPAGLIAEHDIALLETVLRSVDINTHNGKLDLILDSPGGSPVGAEKIILTCRSFCKEFRVIVPRSAMSAATLVCMGADQIVMSDTSEIGPIDPQMEITTREGTSTRPAASHVDAYRDLINKAQEAIKKNTPPHPYLELLRRQDPVFIQMCLKARALSETLAREYLTKYQLRRKPKKKVEEIVQVFLELGEQGTHGRPIRAARALEIGLNVKIEPKEGKLGQAIWELYCRCEHHVRSHNLSKYFLTSHGGINVQAKQTGI